MSMRRCFPSVKARRRRAVAGKSEYPFPRGRDRRVASTMTARYMYGEERYPIKAPLEPFARYTRRLSHILKASLRHMVTYAHPLGYFEALTSAFGRDAGTRAQHCVQSQADVIGHRTGAL
jgi:hypothetical protein